MKILAVGSLAGNIEVFNLRNGTNIFDFRTQDTSVVSLCFNETGSKLYISCFDGRTYVIDLVNGKVVDVLHSYGDITTFAYDTILFNQRYVSCAVSAKGHLRYFVWPTLNEDERFVLGIDD